MIELTPEVQFALAATRQAAWLIKRIQKELAASHSLSKEDRSPVTVADFASQAVVAYLLRQHFREATLVAEESADELRKPENRDLLARITDYVRILVPNAAPEAVCEWIDRGAAAPSDRFWVLDPIDGTKGFLRGDQYVVALALVENGQVVLGALGCPNMDGQLNPRADSGALVLAAHGKGAWSMDLNGSVWRRIHVSDVREAARVRLLRSFEAAHTDGDKIAAFARALGAQAEPVRLDSQAKYAMLAGGRGEVVLRLLSPKRPDYREKIWDQAAGTLIVEEAGGVVTDLDGKPLDFSQGRLLVNNRGVIASNGHLHADMLVALRQIEA